jgi:hypothetical protein
MGMPLSIRASHLSLTTRPGTPQIRHHPRFIILRRQDLCLARAKQPMAAHLRLHPPYRQRQPDCLVTARARLPPGLRLVRRLRLGHHLQRQLLLAHHLPSTRHGRQRRLLEPVTSARPARCCSNSAIPTTTPTSLRHWRQRQLGQALGLRLSDPILQQHLHPRRTLGLGTRRRMVAHSSLQVVHCLGLARQDCAHLDVSGKCRSCELIQLAGHRTQIRGCRLACQLESER